MLKEIDRRNVKGIGERIDYLYVFMGSRLARNIDEAHLITKLIMENTIEVLSIKENMMDCSTNAGKKAWAETIKEAIFDSIEKSANASINMDTAFREKGSISGHLNKGYIKVGNGDNSRIEVDTKYHINEAVILCFELYATGRYTYEEVAKELNERGFKKYKTTKAGDIFYSFNKRDVDHILTSDFYWGRVVIDYRNQNKDALRHFAEHYPHLKMKNGAITVDYTERFRELGTFKPLISKTLFDKCKAIRE